MTHVVPVYVELARNEVDRDEYPDDYLRDGVERRWLTQMVAELSATPNGIGPTAVAHG